MEEKKGILLINKPINITSRKVISIISNKLKIKKIGHTGTLDPLAEGLLILLLNKATKLQEIFMQLRKTYITTIKLGEFSETDDREGPFYKTSNNFIPTQKDIEEILSNFIGEIYQTPPLYSAVKIKGVRAYKLAREGKKIEIPKKKVIIYSIDLLNYSYPFIKIRVECSSGTYIRSLARDIGNLLECGAYMDSLIRIKIGKFQLEKAKNIDEVNKDDIFPLEECIENFKYIKLDSKYLKKIINGSDIFLNKEKILDESSPLLILINNKVIALGKFNKSKSILKINKVLV